MMPRCPELEALSELTAIACTKIKEEHTNVEMSEGWSKAFIRCFSLWKDVYDNQISQHMSAKNEEDHVSTGSMGISRIDIPFRDFDDFIGLLASPKKSYNPSLKPSYDFYNKIETFIIPIDFECIFDAFTQGGKYKSGCFEYEFFVPRNPHPDVISMISCSYNNDNIGACDFEVRVGPKKSPIEKHDPILLAAAQFQEIIIKVFVPAGTTSITIKYIGSYFKQEHRTALATGAWKTKSTRYANGRVLEV